MKINQETFIDINADIYDIEYPKACKIKSNCEEIINYFLNEYGTIRGCAKETCISKSTVHFTIHKYIKHYYYEEYCQIVDILNFNSKYRRKCTRCHPKYRK